MAGTLDGQKSLEIVLGQKLLMPIVEIVFSWLVYMFHCIIQMNAGGDKTTFAIAVIHHQNLSKM